MKKIILMFFILIFTKWVYWNYDWKCILSDSRWDYNIFEEEWLSKIEKLWFCNDKGDIINIFKNYKKYNFIWIKYNKNWKYFLEILKNNKSIFLKEINNGVIHWWISNFWDDYFFIIRWSDKLDFNIQNWFYINWKKVSNSINDFLLDEKLLFYFNRLFFLDTKQSLDLSINNNDFLNYNILFSSKIKDRINAKINILTNKQKLLVLKKLYNYKRDFLINNWFTKKEQKNSWKWWYIYKDNILFIQKNMIKKDYIKFILYDYIYSKTKINLLINNNRADFN